MSVTIVQGEDKRLVIKLRDSAGDPFDLTSYVGGSPDDIWFCVKKADETVLQKKFTLGEITLVGSAILGKLQVKLEETDTPDLDAGPLGFEITLISAGGTDYNVIQFPDALTIVERLCLS